MCRTKTQKRGRPLPSFSIARHILSLGRRAFLSPQGAYTPVWEEALTLAIRYALWQMHRYTQDVGHRKTPSLLKAGFSAIRTYLDEDITATYEMDPAAHSPLEVRLAYPATTALLAYRLAHALYLLGEPILARLLSEEAHSTCGIDIHPAATIEGGIGIDHGTGIVIGETTVIESGVRIYQGVTLGALHPIGAIRGVKRHPTIQKGAVLYAGATILGGDTIIGEGVEVPQGARITHSLFRETI